MIKRSDHQIPDFRRRPLAGPLSCVPGPRKDFSGSSREVALRFWHSWSPVLGVCRSDIFLFSGHSHLNLQHAAKMSFPGMPGFGGAGGANAGVSDQEQAMVKTVCTHSTSSRLDPNLLCDADASGNGVLSRQAGHGRRDGICPWRRLWSLHVKCRFSSPGAL